MEGLEARACAHLCRFPPSCQCRRSMSGRHCSRESTRTASRWPPQGTAHLWWCWVCVCVFLCLCACLGGGCVSERVCARVFVSLYVRASVRARVNEHRGLHENVAASPHKNNRKRREKKKPQDVLCKITYPHRYRRRFRFRSQSFCTP